MKWGWFRRKKAADIVLLNARIQTMDPDYPYAEALACTDGRIQAIGSEEEVRSLIGDATQILDVDGAYTTPGLIELHDRPCETLFGDEYIALSRDWDVSEVEAAIRAFLHDHPHDDRMTAMGYDAARISSEQMAELKDTLDVLVPDRPFVLVAADGLHVLMNTCARELVEAEAEALGLTQVSSGFVASVLFSIDPDNLLNRVDYHTYNLSTLGITSAFVHPMFDPFEEWYRSLLVDAYTADALRQRYFGSLLMELPLPEKAVRHRLDQKSTACMELGGLLQFKTLFIRMRHDSLHPFGLSESYLRSLCETVADPGYHIWIEAMDDLSAPIALQVLSDVHASYRRSVFALLHGGAISEEERADMLTSDVFEFLYSDLEKDTAPVCNLERYTVAAADRLGIVHEAGLLRPDGFADVAVFDANPEDMAGQTARMTLLAGRVAYDRSDPKRSNWTERVQAVSDQTLDLYEPEGM